jgi:hypothetical protein
MANSKKGVSAEKIYGYDSGGGDTEEDFPLGTGPDKKVFVYIAQKYSG